MGDFCLMVRPVFFSWAEVPFFRVLIWMGIALLLPPFFIDRASVCMWSIPLLPAAHICMLWMLKGKFRLRWLTGLFTGICTVFLVWSGHSLHFSAYQTRMPPDCDVEGCMLQLNGPADTSNNRIRVLCRWIAADPSGSNILYDTQIRLETDSTWRAPPPGAFIVVRHARLSRFRNLRNPNAFDTQGLARNKGIAGRLKSAPQQIVTVQSVPPTSLSLQQRAQRLRMQVCKLIYAYLPDREGDLACAILLGERQGMNDEMEQAFSGSGLIHLMAVSGMHVGIFYLMCSWLLFSLLRLPKRPATLGVLLMLWTYALLTGLSPSVVRASGMFSLAAAGKLWQRHASSYNLMSASAFIQIWLDTRLPYQPGFLLSYAAVFGILFLHPRLFSLYWTKNKLLDKIWELSSLSLSAQWFTLPLVLYYFHTFPVYFLPANILVVPLAAPALMGTLILTALSIVPPLADLFAYPLTGLLFGINELTGWIAALPYAQSTGWYWNKTDLILATALIFFIPLGLLFQNRTARLALLASIILWYGIGLTQQINRLRGGDFYLYEGYKRGWAAVCTGRQAWVLRNPDWEDSNMFLVDEPLHSTGIRRIYTVAHTGVVRIRWQNKTALWISQKEAMPIRDLPPADVLILESEWKKEHILSIANKYPILIFGSGFKPYFCQNIRTKTGRNQASCRCVSETGAINLWNINTSKPLSEKE